MAYCIFLCLLGQDKKREMNEFWVIFRYDKEYECYLDKLNDNVKLY